MSDLVKMSRIGKKPVKIPEGVTVNVEKDVVKVVGPRGELKQKIPPRLQVVVDKNKVVVERTKEESRAKAMHGLLRSLIANMLWGVSKGWNKGLELQGVGYRASLLGEKLVLSLGFSHPVEVVKPKGIEFELKANRINVKGIDKQLVGQTAAYIRSLRPPEPYKGKGIRYVGEAVRRKPGKAARAIGEAG